MFARLFLLFTALSFLELALLVVIGREIGVLATIAMVIVTGLVGAWLAKREGLRVLREYQRSIAELRMPEEGLTSALLVLVGGGLLIAPGVLSDLLGILLMIPAFRRVVARHVERYVREHVLVEPRAARGGSARRRVEVRPAPSDARASDPGAPAEGTSTEAGVEVLEPDLVVDRRGRVIAHLED